MRRVLFAAVVAVLGFALAAAQEPKPAQPPAPQPKAVPAQPAQPLPIRVAGVTPARMAQLEEEVETLDAHRDVKRAYVRTAEQTPHKGRECGSTFTKKTQSDIQRERVQ